MCCGARRWLGWRAWPPRPFCSRLSSLQPPPSCSKLQSSLLYNAERVRWSGLGTLASATSLSGPETWPRDCWPPSQIGLGALAELAGLCSSLSRSGPVRGRDGSPSRSGLGGGPGPPRVPGTISSGRRQNTRRGALVCHQVRAGEAEGGPGTPLAYSRRPEVPPLPAGAADWLKRGARPPSAPPPDRRRAEGRGRARRSRFR